MKDNLLKFRDTFKVSEEKLTLPKCSENFLSLELREKVTNEKIDALEYLKINSSPLPEGSFKSVRIVDAKLLTSATTTRKKVEISVLSEVPLTYIPGDTFGFCVENNEEEINLLFKLIDIPDFKELSYTLDIVPNSKKKLPSHYPKRGSVYELIKYCCNLRVIPKKQHLNMISSYCLDDIHRSALQALSSREKSKTYDELIFANHITILDLLQVFHSCQIPLVRLLELFPKLNPRIFSVTSSPLMGSHLLTFLISVTEVHFESEFFTDIKGLCTGWIYDQVMKLPSKVSDGCIATMLSSLSLSEVKDSQNMYVFKRSSNGFSLPDATNLPLIMISAGTGIAPFMSFLRHRNLLYDEHSTPVYMFWGGQHPLEDYLFESELEHYRQKGLITELVTAFSQYDDCLYIQEKLLNYGDRIMREMNKNGIMYVCGSSAMIRSVKEVVCKMISTFLELGENMGRETLDGWVKSNQFKVDIW